MVSVSLLNRLSLGVLRSPLVWGALASLGFYAGVHSLVRGGGWQGVFAQRYFANHWCLYVETGAFFVGLAALVLKALDAAGQSARLKQPILPQDGVRLPPAEAGRLLTGLSALPPEQSRSYLVKRLTDALEWVRRDESADKLGDELKYLADLDVARSHGSFAMLRLIIWAIPILGFLGTVIGITMAIASISPQSLEDSLPEVTGGLAVAFDTTAIALGFSMLLMFGQYLVEGQEGKLLAGVDAAAAHELAGRFEQLPSGGDPALSAVRRMTESIVQSSNRLSEKQSALWQEAIQAADRRGAELAKTCREQLEGTLTAGMSQGLEGFAGRLASAAAAAEEGNRQQWGRLTAAAVDQAGALAAHQSELKQQSETLLAVVDAAGGVARLEDALNRNLSAVAGAQHLQETLLNLTAAVHLLNARLGQLPSGAPPIALGGAKLSGRAA